VASLLGLNKKKNYSHHCDMENGGEFWKGIEGKDPEKQGEKIKSKKMYLPFYQKK